MWTIADGYVESPRGIGSEPVELWRLDARDRIDDAVTSFDATTGDPLWAEAYSPDGTSAQPAADDLVALSGRELRIVDRDGEERWRDAIDPSAGRLAASLVHGLE